MSSDPFTDSGPVGQSITHKGKTYFLSPRVLEGRFMRQLRAFISDLNRIELSKLLNANKGMPRDVIEILVDRYKPLISVTFRDINLAAQMPEVLAKMIELGCDDIKKYDEAMELVDDYPNFIELMETVLIATGLELIKNSKAPATESVDSGQDLEKSELPEAEEMTAEALPNL